MRVSRGWFARMGHTNCLVPASKESAGLVEDLGEGEGLVLAIERVRSLSWHNMYYGCCREIGRNQDPQRDEHSIDYELRIRAGHFDKMIVDGHDVLVPKRIAFNKLSADQWAQLWPSLDLAMQEHFGFDFEAWKRHAA